MTSCERRYDVFSIISLNRDVMDISLLQAEVTNLSNILVAAEAQLLWDQRLINVGDCSASTC